MIYLGSDKLSYTNKEVILGIAEYLKFGGGETRFKIVESKTANDDSEEYEDLEEDTYENFNTLPAV